MKRNEKMLALYWLGFVTEEAGFGKSQYVSNVALFEHRCSFC